MGDEHHDEQDDHRNHGQGAVIEDFAGKVGFALLPVAQFGAVFDADLVQMLKVVEKFMRIGIAILWDLAPAPGRGPPAVAARWRGRRRVGGMGWFRRRSFMAASGEGPVEGELAGEHFVEDDAHGVDVGAAVAALALHLLGGDVVGRAEGGGEVGVGEAARPRSRRRCRSR